MGIRVWWYANYRTWQEGIRPDLSAQPPRCRCGQTAEGYTFERGRGDGSVPWPVEASRWVGGGWEYVCAQCYPGARDVVAGLAL